MIDLKQQIDKFIEEWATPGLEEPTKKALLALFNEAVSEIIGEDEPTAINGNATGYTIRAKLNELRAEQRLKQKEVLS